MLRVNIPKDQAIFVKLPQMAGKVRKNVLQATYRLAIELQSYIVRNKLSGQVLNKITGNLQQSIQQNVIEGATEIRGEVFSAGDVKYAGIHEFGGVIHHPGSDKFQAFQGKSGGMVFTNKTAAHLIPMPERSFMRSSLAENKIHIQDTYEDAVMGALK